MSAAANSFNPRDGDLVEYLDAKISEDNAVPGESDINEINLCHYEPEDIPHLTKIPSTHTWHIISPVKRRNGSRQQIMRSTRRGFWKVTGKKATVKNFGRTVGFKRYLTFYEKDENASASNSANADSSSRATIYKRTGWVIHEIHSFIQHAQKDNYVLCKLMKNPIVPSIDVLPPVPSPVAIDVLPPVPSRVAAATDQVMRQQMQNVTTNFTYGFGGNLDNFSTGFQSFDHGPLIRDHNEIAQPIVIPAVGSLVAAATNQMQNDTNLMENICDGLDDFSTSFQSSDLDQLSGAFDEISTNMIANWKSGIP